MWRDKDGNIYVTDQELDELTRFKWRALIIPLLIGVALSLLISALVSWSAAASPSCMSKHEARRHYGNTHLYWHTSRRCWDNHRGGRRQYRDPVFSKVASTGDIPIPRPKDQRGIWTGGPRDTEMQTRFAGPPIVLESKGLDANLRFVPWELRIAGSF